MRSARGRVFNPQRAARCGQRFSEDERLKLLSFTGSDKVGWMLKSNAGKKPVVMELGGNAACLVDADADIDDAVDRLVFGGFYQSGQSCISVQRVQIHRDIYDEVKTRLVEKVGALKGGDPRDPETFIGPLISEDDAKRVVEWIEEAEEKGATRLVGGEREGSVVRPAVLENVPRDCRIYDKELFGPAMVIEPFDDFDEALQVINQSRYGLQAGCSCAISARSEGLGSARGRRRDHQRRARASASITCLTAA